MPAAGSHTLMHENVIRPAIARGLEEWQYLLGVEDGYCPVYAGRSMVGSPLTPSVDTNYFPKEVVEMYGEAWTSGILVDAAGQQITDDEEEVGITIKPLNTYFLKGEDFLGPTGQKAAINIIWDDVINLDLK